MKIIIIGPAHPFRGGIADTNESLCQSLIDTGHDASIITFTVQYPELLFPGKTQYRTDTISHPFRIDRMINSINPINWIFAAKKINARNPDLVIVRYWMPFFAPSTGSIIKLLNKRTKVIAMCDNVIPHEKRIGDHVLTKYFTNSFDAFITLSNTTYKELDLFTNKPKTYSPHPINYGLGKKIPKHIAREKLKLDPNKKYLLFFGLIRAYKGLDLTLKTIGLDKMKKLDINLLVVGEFYESKDKYLDLIDELDIKDKVTIIDKFVPTDDIKNYFSAADMAIQTYKTASQSGVSQIAFNFDCPILVTNVGGLSEVVLHNKVGYVCEKDPNEIAEAISDFYINDRKDTFIKNILVEKQKYTWQTFAQRILDLYREV